MKTQTLQGRMKAKKEESIEMLKKEGQYIEYCTERGFVYEITKSVYGVLTRIQLSLKNGNILVHSMNKLQ